MSGCGILYVVECKILRLRFQKILLLKKCQFQSYIATMSLQLLTNGFIVHVVWHTNHKSLFCNVGNNWVRHNNSGVDEGEVRRFSND